MSHDPVQTVTDLDTAHAIRNTLTRIGCTFEELRDWAQTWDYPTVRHKMAWYAIGPYYDQRDHFTNLLEAP
ncbi:hypothetical protein [Nocardia farcinica]|uniref:Uncharacterized protein n=1 Tax=Nocardia farcinica (strain IFM 10152) TaxID=247156 RepID=Q5YSN5_NOCFA|nr:hypothetical protein [Nocardia farcinica]BAD58806.1 hypothetical protein NFA_39580 [Nocardia farcinica IFM 10152]